MESDNQCSCSERNDAPYFLCLLCDGGLCQKCCFGELEEGDRQHIKCPQKKKLPKSHVGDKDGEGNPVHIEDAHGVQKSPNVDEEIESLSSNEAKESSETLQDKDSLPTPRRSPRKAVLEQSATRSMPQELKNIEGKRGANAGPFPPPDESKVWTNSASYSAHNRVLHNVADTCTEYFTRTLQTQDKYPNTNLEVSFEFKCRMVHESGKESYHRFEIGNPAYLSNPAQLYKEVHPKKSLRQTIRNIQLKIQNKDILELPMKPASKISKPSFKTSQNNSSQKKSGKVLATSGIKSSEELFGHEDGTSDDNIDLTLSRTPKPTNQTPPFVSVTPADHLRAPFNKLSGKSEHLKNKPDNKIKITKKKASSDQPHTPTNVKAPKKRKITVMDGDSGPRKEQDVDDDLALVAPVPGGSGKDQDEAEEESVVRVRGKGRGKTAGNGTKDKGVGKGKGRGKGRGAKK